MEHRALIIALVFVLNAIPVWAFEIRKPQRDENRLRIELEAVPSPAQENMDRYVRDLPPTRRRIQLPRNAHVKTTRRKSGK